MAAYPGGVPTIKEITKVFNNVTPRNAESLDEGCGQAIHDIMDFINAVNCGKSDAKIATGYFTDIRTETITASGQVFADSFVTMNSIACGTLVVGSTATISTLNVEGTATFANPIDLVTTGTKLGSVELDNTDDGYVIPETVTTIISNSTDGKIDMTLPTTVGNQGRMYIFYNVASPNYTMITTDNTDEEYFLGCSSVAAYRATMSEAEDKLTIIGIPDGWLVISQSGVTFS